MKFPIWTAVLKVLPFFHARPAGNLSPPVRSVPTPSPGAPAGSGYKLGARSRSELSGVHPDLVACVERAIAITTQDFSVHDGIRSPAEQKELVARGASKTLNSRHLTQPDGYGHAVDLVPYVNGQLRWEWPLIYPVAEAMAIAARERGVSLRWGGVWDRVLETLPADADGLKKAVQAYVVRHPGPDFIDGPHFEIYPARAAEARAAA